MSSAKGMQPRNESAHARIAAALVSFGTELSLDLGEPPRIGIPTIQKDLPYRIVRQNEFMADTLEALKTAVEGLE